MVDKTKINTPAARLKAARARMYSTARQATEMLGMPYGTYSSYENGWRPIDTETAVFLAKHFGVTPEWLLFGTQQGAPGTASQRNGYKKISVFLVTEVSYFKQIVSGSKPELGGKTMFLADEQDELPERIFMVEVPDDSMMPEGQMPAPPLFPIPRGAKAVVDPDATFGTGDMVHVIVGKTSVIRTLAAFSAGTLQARLVALNPKFAEIALDPKRDVIVGKVIGQISLTGF